jgi:hypothetical protein
VDQNNEAPPERTHGAGGVYWLVWAPFLLLVVYPLSIGPAARLHKACPPARPAIEAAYYPLVALGKDNEKIASSLNWYVMKIWGVK